MNILNERELRGVVSHELIHVYNHDILNSTVASAIATVITYFGYVLMYSGSECAKSAKRRCPVLKVIGKVLSAIFVPLGSIFVKLAISRARELDADRSASMLTGDPAALASALNKISYGVKMHKMDLHSGVQAIASLMIVNPFANYDSKLLKLFSRQQDVNRRVDSLMLMSSKMESLVQEDARGEIDHVEHDSDSVFRFKNGAKYNVEYGKGVSGGVVAVSGA